MLRPVDFCLPALAMKELNEKGTFERGTEMNGGARGRFGAGKRLDQANSCLETDASGF
jgi:hypothetical protein